MSMRLSVPSRQLSICYVLCWLDALPPTHPPTHPEPLAASRTRNHHDNSMEHDGRCYNCGEEGHSIHTCTKPKQVRSFHVERGAGSHTAEGCCG